MQYTSVPISRLEQEAACLTAVNFRRSATAPEMMVAVLMANTN